MIFSALGITILAAFGFWSVGGFLLRIGGALLVLAGAVGLATAGDPQQPPFYDARRTALVGWALPIRATSRRLEERTGELGLRRSRGGLATNGLS
jgi:hypothetical protein